MNKETKTKKVDYMTRAKGDLQHMRISSEFMQCDKCKTYLGVLCCMRKALFKKKVTKYFVLCPSCGHINERAKGGLAKEFDKRW